MIAVLLSLAGSLMNAVASVCQRQANRTEPDQRSLLRMLLDLAGRPSWWAGIVAMISGFALEASALAVGRISLVEPVMISELPLTLIGAHLVFGAHLGRRGWLAIAGLATGVAAFVWALAPYGGAPGAVPVWLWLLAGGATAGAAGVFLVLARRWRRARAALLGLATGTTFGLMSALVAGIGGVYHIGGLALVVSSWQTYAAIVVGPTSFFLLQRALQAGSLVASQPGFTLVNPLTAVLWGVLVFGERVRGGVYLAVAVVAAVVIVTATLLLVRHADETSAVSDRSDDERAGARPTDPSGRARETG